MLLYSKLHFQQYLCYTCDKTSVGRFAQSECQKNETDVLSVMWKKLVMSYRVSKCVCEDCANKYIHRDNMR